MGSSSAQRVRYHRSSEATELGPQSGRQNCTNSVDGGVDAPPRRLVSVVQTIVSGHRLADRCDESAHPPADSSPPRARPEASSAEDVATLGGRSGWKRSVVQERGGSCKDRHHPYDLSMRRNVPPSDWRTGESAGLSRQPGRRNAQRRTERIGQPGYGYGHGRATATVRLRLRLPSDRRKRTSAKRLQPKIRYGAPSFTAGIRPAGAAPSFAAGSFGASCGGGGGRRMETSHSATSTWRACGWTTISVFDAAS